MELAGSAPLVSMPGAFQVGKGVIPFGQRGKLFFLEITGELIPLANLSRATSLWPRSSLKEVTDQVDHVSGIYLTITVGVAGSQRSRR